MSNVSNKGKQYYFIVVGAGAAGSVVAAELSLSAQLLVIESGRPDDAPTLANPSCRGVRPTDRGPRQEMKSKYLASGSYGRINFGGN